MRLALARRRIRGLSRLSPESWRATATRLRGPLYAAEGAGTAYQGRFGRSGSGRAATVSACVAHVGPWGELDVDTSDEPPWGDSAFEDYRLTSDWLHRAVRPGRIAFPLTITADRWARNVLVDGLPTRFLFVGDDTIWCAHGAVNGRRVGVSGTGWPQDRLTLVTVALREVRQEVPERP